MGVAAQDTNLEGDEEEESVDKDTPDGYIGKNAAKQTLSVEGNSSVPVQSNECPGQGSGDSWEVDKAGRGRVAEVERRQVEEVDDQDQLSPNEVGSDKEHDESEMEEVVEDEVAANGRCGLDMVGVGREQVPDVASLEHKEHNPSIC